MEAFLLSESDLKNILGSGGKPDFMALREKNLLNADNCKVISTCGDDGFMEACFQSLCFKNLKRQIGDQLIYEVHYRILFLAKLQLDFCGEMISKNIWVIVFVNTYKVIKI